MDKHIKQQIEQILDEGTGSYRSVIVQMETNKVLMKKLLQTSSVAIRNRLMSSSAREVLPPDLAEMNINRSKKRRKVPSFDHSMASQMSRQALEVITKSAMRTIGFESLLPLIDSDFTNKAIVNMLDRAKDKGSIPLKITNSSKVTQFWSSASAVLELKQDELWDLPKKVKNISDVYLNRPVSTPPVVEVSPSSLPKNIIENKTSAWGVEATGALSVWGAYGARGKGVKIAVLDTGFDATHPDLASRLSPSDWAEFDSRGDIIANSTPYDSGMHGTHVAGTIAGGNASGQWIGMAPEAKLAAGLVLKGGGGTTAQVLAGMQWAIDKGVDVISMSLGGLQMSSDVIDTYTRTIINANQLGIPVVAAIGNNGSQTTGSPGNDYFSFAVGATDSFDKSAGFSGGRTQIIYESRYIEPRYLPLPYSKPDVSAPGVAIKSAIPGGKYATWNGTSMAAPHVAGAIALLLSATDLRNKVPLNELAYIIQDLITGSVEELGESGKDHRYGFGRVDILRAIGIAKDRGY